VSPPPRLEGQVIAFDDQVGLGEIEADAVPDGSPGRFGFHCTQIADGSRTVPVGMRVTFGLLAGRGGHWEAADIRPETTAVPLL
jgi:CspA family cold shock protein